MDWSLGRISASLEMWRSFHFDKWWPWGVIRNQAQIFHKRRCIYVSYALCCCGLSNITMTSYERHVNWNHRPFDCLFKNVCGPISKKYQSPHYWPFGVGGGDSTGTGELPAQMVSNVEKAAVWWRLHVMTILIKVTSLTLEHSCVFHIASELILRDMFIPVSALHTANAADLGNPSGYMQSVYPAFGTWRIILLQPWFWISG